MHASGPSVGPWTVGEAAGLQGLPHVGRAQQGGSRAMRSPGWRAGTGAGICTAHSMGCRSGAASAATLCICMQECWQEYAWSWWGTPGEE